MTHAPAMTSQDASLAAIAAQLKIIADEAKTQTKLLAQIAAAAQTSARPYDNNR